MLWASNLRLGPSFRCFERDIERLKMRRFPIGFLVSIAFGCNELELELVTASSVVVEQTLTRDSLLRSSSEDSGKAPEKSC